MSATYGYVRPRRSRFGRVALAGGVERAWFRYLIVGEFSVETPYVVVGRTWTKWGARRAVDALRSGVKT